MAVASFIPRSVSLSPPRPHFESRTSNPAKLTNDEKSTRKPSTFKSNRKTVTFNEKVRVRKIFSIDGMTEKEIKKYWLSERESNKIRRSARRLIHKAVNDEDNLSTEEHESLRGLEGHFGSRETIRKQSRAVAIAEILKEQERQWIMQIPYCAEGFRSVTEEISTISHKFAHSVALKDQDEV